MELPVFLIMFLLWWSDEVRVGDLLQNETQFTAYLANLLKNSSVAHELLNANVNTSDVSPKQWWV